MCLFVSSLLSFPLFSTIYFLLRSRSFGLYRIVKKECQLDPILFRKFLALLCNDAGLYYTNFCNCLHLSLSLSFSLSLIISPSLSHSLSLILSFSFSLSLSLIISSSLSLSPLLHLTQQRRIEETVVPENNTDHDSRSVVYTNK